MPFASGFSLTGSGALFALCKAKDLQCLHRFGAARQGNTRYGTGSEPAGATRRATMHYAYPAIYSATLGSLPTKTDVSHLCSSARPYGLPLWIS